jgi:hypothetical protein
LPKEIVAKVRRFSHSAPLIRWSVRHKEASPTKQPIDVLVFLGRVNGGM